MSRPSTRNLCPVCEKPTAPQHTPFCSQGCRDRDLLQWLGDGYRIPGPPADETSESGVDSGREAD
jgi:hypothetical protein